MGFYGSGDIQAMIEDFGVDVAIVGQQNTTKALQDVADEVMLESLGAAIEGKVTMLTIQTGTLAGLAAGAQLSVPLGGNPPTIQVFLVRDMRQVDDGALTQIFCSGVI